MFCIVNSIDEHFARSLGKLWPLTTTTTTFNRDHASSKIEPIVDDHFARALGATTWKKLKERS